SISVTDRSTMRAPFFLIKFPPVDPKTFCSITSSIAAFTASGSAGSTGSSSLYVTVLPNSFSKISSNVFISHPPFLLDYPLALLLVFRDIRVVDTLHSKERQCLQPRKRMRHRIQLISRRICLHIIERLRLQNDVSGRRVYPIVQSQTQLRPDLPCYCHRSSPRFHHYYRDPK